MKSIIFVLLAQAATVADLTYRVEEAHIPERGVVNQCRIQTVGREFILTPPQSWSWNAQPRSNKISFLNDEISAGIHLEFHKDKRPGTSAQLLRENYLRIEIREEFEAISGCGSGKACEAEVWSTETYSFVVREGVFDCSGGQFIIRLQVPLEHLERGDRAWNMVLNSLREGR